MDEVGKLCHPFIKFVYNAFDTINNPDLGFGILALEIQKDGSYLKGTFYNNNDPNKPDVGDSFTIKKVSRLAN